jgi:integrase
MAVETLSSLFGLALDDDVIKSSPLHGQRSRRTRGKRRAVGRVVEPIKPERLVDPYLLERLRRSRELLDRKRDTTLLALLGYEGLRPGEATVLDWNELLDERGHARRFATIARTCTYGPDGWVEVETTKTGSFRVIQIFEPVREMVEEFYDWAGQPDPSGGVFVSELGKKLTSHDVWGMIRRATAASKMKPFAPYDLRHTCASLLHAGGDSSRPGVGWSIGEVAAHLGHSIEVCSRIYVHVFKHSRYRGVPIEEIYANARAAALQALPGDVRADFHGRRLRETYRRLK